MPKTVSKEEEERLRAEYGRIAHRYMDGLDEAELYQLSLLGRELYSAELPPSEVAQIHFDVVREILRDRDPAEHGTIVAQLSPLLMEALVIHGETHLEVRGLLDELQTRYSELDGTKRELEASQDALRVQTEQLVQTEKMTALGLLSAEVAHEMNQPLNAMKIISQDVLRDIRKDRLEPGTVETSLLEVLEQVEKVSAIIDHLRIYSRPTAGVRRERLDVRAPIEDVFKLIGRQLIVHGIRVDKELAPGLYVTGDPLRLEQAFMNLILNARDAVEASGRAKGKLIVVRGRSAPGTNRLGRSVVVEIEDNGIGMPAALLPKIFDAFMTTKEPGRGTGLGLGVVKQIIEEHGGTVDVRSEVGVGSTFRVELPADTPRAP